MMLQRKRWVNLTSFTSGSWLSIHAISMQGVFINFSKSSKSWAAVPNNARQTDRVTPRTDSDTSFDYPVWPMWLCLCELWIQWPTCFTARRHRRRHWHEPIRLGTFSSPNFSGEYVFVLWYVFYVASLMDISRDVVEGKPFCAQFRHFCVCRVLKSRLFWADINPWFICYYHRSAKETGYNELVVSD